MALAAVRARRDFAPHTISVVTAAPGGVRGRSCSG